MKSVCAPTRGAPTDFTTVLPDQAHTCNNLRLSPSSMVQLQCNFSLLHFFVFATCKKTRVLSPPTFQGRYGVHCNKYPLHCDFVLLHFGFATTTCCMQLLVIVSRPRGTSRHKTDHHTHSPFERMEQRTAERVQQRTAEQVMDMPIPQVFFLKE